MGDPKLILKCRRCADCIGEEHHWQESIRTDDGDWQCKHCDEVSEGVECETCGADIPIAVADEARDCPSCASEKELRDG